MDSYGTVNSKMQELEKQQAFSVLMRKVYTWMTMALVITGICAYGVANSPALLQIIYSTPMAMIVLCIAEVGLVFWLSARIQKMALTTATIMFIVYSVLNGATMATLFIIYTQSSIARVFFITAATFGITALVGSTIKKDLSSLGGFLIMSLIGVIIAGVVNIFIKSSAFDFIISIVTVLIFVGLTAYDSQKIKQMLLMAPDADETAQKVALMGALSLYLDFINLFIHLLRIFGTRRD
ncbi:MAG: Bax inhibitor-1/YccA family protein [Prevotella sp.]|nr:Bax inhibitor-1/YccA family protein [Prevotella sp.]